MRCKIQIENTVQTCNRQTRKTISTRYALAAQIIYTAATQHAPGR